MHASIDDEYKPGIVVSRFGSLLALGATALALVVVIALECIIYRDVFGIFWYL